MNTKNIITITGCIIAVMSVGFGGTYMLMNAKKPDSNIATGAVPVAQASMPIAKAEAKPVEKPASASVKDQSADNTTEAESGMAIYDPNPADKTALNVIKKMYRKWEDNTDGFTLVINNATPAFKKVLNAASHPNIYPATTCSVLSTNDLMFNTGDVDYGYKNHSKVKSAYSGYGYAVDVTVGKKEIATYNMSCKNGSCKISDIVYPDGSSLKESLQKECM